jgi:hypothetical protein
MVRQQVLYIEEKAGHRKESRTRGPSRRLAGLSERRAVCRRRLARFGRFLLDGLFWDIEGAGAVSGARHGIIVVDAARGCQRWATQSN